MDLPEDASSQVDSPAALSAPLKIATERDLRAHIRHICRRLDANPEISRLLFINPILVLEDVGLELSAEVREHIMNALRFPPKRRARMEALQAEIEQLRADTDRAVPVAATAANESTDEATDESTAVSTALASRQAELARLRQGAMVFFPRSTYEQFKRGEKKHRWIKAIRFGV